MARMITETVERWCCQPQDLVVDEGRKEGINVRATSPAGSYYNPWRYVVCRHCGTRHEYVSFTNKSGSRDFDYRVSKEQ